MIDPKMIPDEVVEAAEKAFTDAMLTVPQPDPIRSAIAAALSAWTGAEVKTPFWPNDDGVWIVPRHGWLLPLAQKDATDE